MKSAVLLSGATGFLGTAIVEELVQTTRATIFVLVRARRGRTPAQRLESLWCEKPTLCDVVGSRVIAVEGDVERDLLGLDQARYDELASAVGVVVHAAAEVGVNQTEQRFWNVNVRGTYNMLEFAKRARQRGGLRRFVHVSTAYVAGTRQGTVPERLFANDQYNSLYEQSKHEAELLVSTYDKDVPYAIVRPAQIVGDSSTGFVATFNTLYYPLKRYLQGGLRVIPASRDLRVNMVPVDYVARVACRAALDEGTWKGRVFHAVGRPDELPTLGELVEAVRAWAAKNLQVELPAPCYVPVRGLDALGRLRNLRRSVAAKRRGPLRNMLALAPYFFEERTYEVANARGLVGEDFPRWQEYLPNLLAYATRRGFLNHTDRTVYEQILMRNRPGASTRIRYFDVGAAGVVEHQGTEVREEVLRIARALIAHGVRPGDRVATLGVNSVRYFSLDVAIGLVGAASVPIYYTSSTADVAALVAASGARTLFVGTDRMLDELQLDKVRADVVSISDREGLRPGIKSWSAFVDGGRRVGGDATAGTGAIAGGGTGTAIPTGTGTAADQLAGDAWLPYVSPNSLATIRYTSGTTGQPKGVTFTQQQVRWMGEVMPAVLDWRTRVSGKVRYLSFLPMSHVVEGILVAYAPYYILANIDMYYLNDFSRLVEALPKVRPNLFFSVPRFYEKVWNQFASTGVGRLWIGLPDGMAKRLLAHPLRYVVLRRAGLDRCRQLIVGSAPIGLELLESFRSLGVEIHNAFGVTEAPLVTLSRLGNNELGSVGQLLPNTQARLDAEGLVYVRGPQVTRCYDGAEDPAVDKDGWFCTGDLGAWSPQGNLVLKGRKKEILVTSYGKNIAPQKIEVLLKGIDGVSEAMVVADGRPFTSALLWLEDELVATAANAEKGGQGYDFAALDASVRRVNKELSHPEQVKRWAVCARPLSVAAGELTPNLKLRRNVVAQTRAAAIEALYDGWDAQGARVAGGASGDAALPGGSGALAAPDSCDVLHRGEA